MSEKMLDEDDFELAQTVLLTLARQVLPIPIPEFLEAIQKAKSESKSHQPQELTEDLENLEIIVRACNDFRNTLLNLNNKTDKSKTNVLSYPPSFSQPL